MNRYNLIDGEMVEDSNGMYVVYTDYSSAINNINAQINSMNAYSVVVQSYIETLL